MCWFKLLALQIFKPTIVHLNDNFFFSGNQSNTMSYFVFSIEPDPDTTTSSLYEDSDASVPHSPTSESNISFRNTPSQSHPPLRVAKSAEMLTPSSRRRFFFSPLNDTSESDKNSKNRENVRIDSQERPKFHLVIEGEGNPPVGQRTPRNSRSQKTKLHRDSSDPDFTHRPHSVHVERPHSELYTTTPQNLAIPSPNYMRQYNSPVLDSQSNTSLHSPVRSDSFGHAGIPRSSSSSGLTCAGSSSPRITSSAQRPLDIRRTERPPSSGANDGWRQWKNISSDKPNEGFEQETLVWFSVRFDNFGTKWANSWDFGTFCPP